MDENNLIGKNNYLPWHLKEELQFFKKITFGKTILFGRLTFEGIGRILPNRKIFVLTTRKDYIINHPNVKIITDLNFIINFYYKNLINDIYVCGGKKIYELTLPYADKLIVSFIKGKYNGNIYFPIFDLTKQFVLIKIIELEKFVIKYYVKERKDN